MSRQRVAIDLFCGEGGFGTGLHRAGFDVIGVDKDPERLARYPFRTIEADALEFLQRLIDGGTWEWVGLGAVDYIHASPTCTGYSRGTAALPDRLQRYDRLIAVTRDLLQQTGKPYTIENVEDAKPELVDPLTLCWTEFYEPGSVIDDDGTPLWMRRHRLIESNAPLMGAGGCRHPKGMQCAGAYGAARRDKWEAKNIRKGGYVPASLDVLRALVDADWMTEQGCFLSIPPAYAEHVGRQILAHLAVAA